MGGFGLTAAYLTQINGITPKFDAKAENAIVNANYSLEGVGKLSAYYYDIDQLDDASKTETMIETMGTRLAGKTALSDSMSLIYALELATQENAGNNKEADYMLAELGAGFGKFSVIGGYRSFRF